VAETGLTSNLAVAAALGAALSCAVPLWSFMALRSVGRLTAINAGAIAAHYGPVSVVTFAAENDMLAVRPMPRWPNW
jgi:hypothetical protein